MEGRAVPVTDLTPIGAMRIFLEEALIDEFLDLYAGTVSELNEWYLKTSSDPRRRLADYGFEPAPAQFATGIARFTVTADSIIPPGLLVRRAALSGDTTLLKYAVMPNPQNSAGWPILTGYLDVPIRAVASGSQYNVAANTITEIDSNTGIPFVDPGINVQPVVNLFPLVNGSDGADNPTAVRDFQLFLAANGANRATIQKAILEYTDPLTGIRPVHSITFREWDGNVLLSVEGDAVAVIFYVEDGSGSASGVRRPPTGLIGALQVLLDGSDREDVPGVRGAGLPAAVVSAVPFFIPVTVAVDIEPDATSATVQILVTDAIQRFIVRLPVAGSGPFGSQGDFIFAHLFKTVVDVPGVLRADFTFPFQDINLPLGYKAMPGTILVTARAVVA